MRQLSDNTCLRSIVWYSDFWAKLLGPKFCPSSHGRPYTLNHTFNTDWNKWVIKKKKRYDLGRVMWEIWEKLEEEKNRYHQNTLCLCMEFLIDTYDKNFKSFVWGIQRCLAVNSASWTGCGRQRHGDTCKLEANLAYTASSEPARVTRWESVSVTESNSLQTLSV